MAEPSYFNLTVLTGILSDPLIAAFAAFRNGKSAALKAAFLHELFERKAEEHFATYVADVVMKDENAFSRACAAGDILSDYLKKAYIADLEEIGRALDFESPDFCMGKAPLPFKSWDEKAANLLYAHYQSSGYGKFIGHFEFRCDRERGLVPVNPVSLTLSDLKGFEREKAEIYEDIENFVKGLPCADILLYGESGTGRSSALRATANAFSQQRLRLVELSRDDLSLLPRVVERLSAIPLRFLILIESLEPNLRMPDFNAENILLAGTSFGPVEGFGLQIPFRSDCEKYLFIVRELVKESKIKLSAEEIETLSERWSQRRGFSPRSAREFVGYLLACQKKGKEIKL